MGLEGADKDKVVVIGDGVDAARLATTMRKKVGQTDIISVAEVKKKAIYMYSWLIKFLPKDTTFSFIFLSTRRERCILARY